MVMDAMKGFISSAENFFNVKNEVKTMAPVAKIASVVTGVFAFALFVHGGAGLGVLLTASLLGVASRDLFEISANMEKSSVALNSVMSDENNLKNLTEKTWLIGPLAKLIFDSLKTA